MHCISEQLYCIELQSCSNLLSCIALQSLTFHRIDGTFLSWSFDLRTNLLSSFPLPEGVEPIPPEVLLPPKFRLEISDNNEDDNKGATKHPMEISKSCDEDSAQVTEPALNTSRLEEFLPTNFNQRLTGTLTALDTLTLKRINAAV